MYENLAIIALFAFLYSAVAGRLEKTVISGPLVYIAFGLLCGPLALGILNIEVSAVEMRVLADLTLALFLFIDAANADLSVLKGNIKIPARMLGVGLPLIILSGFGVGMVLFDELSFYELALLATMLAATDAALGKAVITNPAVPSRVREGLNVESGLNDGICVPILFVFIALAVGSTEGSSASLAITLVAEEIGIGLAVGLGLTAIGTWILRRCHELGWITDIWGQIPVIALSVGCFAVAQSVHGSGYIAAFSGGILFGYLAKQSKHELLHAAEGVGETMALFTWVIFAVIIGKYFEFFSWEIVVYALFSLTIVRIIPIYLSLTGTGESNNSKLFLGWFGPRGLASIVFAVIVLNHEIAGGKIIALTVICTVILSIIAHGLTANPLARAFSRSESGGNARQ
jgi:NhaP-type Na+/H+ or K+/H+ antiporter